MDPPPPPQAPAASDAPMGDSRPRRESTSQQSEDSQTAADFIRDQMQLEADAREAMPYSIDNCTKQLGPLRQNVYACLTCNPPPLNPDDDFSPAGVCYACSVQCHGEHELVEIFQKRGFTCDCGTTRFTALQPCTLRLNSETNTKGGVHSETAEPNNKYNQNFRNLFCSCSIDYKAQEQKGTMFQCLGLGTIETGGCGEDWYHPGCLMGLGPRWYENMEKKDTAAADGQPIEADDNDAPLPVGFPGEEDFEHLICYKCVEANPWIKRYAGTRGFLSPVFFKQESMKAADAGEAAPAERAASPSKRKLEDEDDANDSQSKRVKAEPESSDGSTTAAPALHDVPIKVKDEDVKQEATTSTPMSSCKLDSLPAAPTGPFSLFVRSDFREQFCHCSNCFPLLKPHPQLLEEEEAYEPPLSESGSEAGSSRNSLLERGESALRNVDRVRAIEGVMAYNHMKEKLRPFFQQFAESGQAISAEDIKEYFAKLRGDETGKQEGEGEGGSDGGGNRKEQSGY